MGKEYITEFDRQTECYKGKKLLLHSCCAPCSSATVEMIRQFFDTTLYFYNPNIQPVEEFDKRANELKRFIGGFAPEMRVIIADYEGEKFDELAKGLENAPEKGERCRLCYAQRMDKAARYAMENGYDLFTTTLSISPHKNADWINEIGRELEAKYGVKFLSSDFKKRGGYKRSIELSREYNLYRQNYCGCKFSKR